MHFFVFLCRELRLLGRTEFLAVENVAAFLVLLVDVLFEL